jgi:signal transduction histidine kinase
MNFKIRSAILFTGWVAIILLASYIAIYIQYADFKKDEFYLRLEQKAISTYKLFTEDKEIEKENDEILNDLGDDKVLIFDEDHKLIFSSVDDKAISYSEELLNSIKQEKIIRYSNADEEVIGMLVSYKGKRALVLASANDLFGKTKLQNLFYILLFSYFGALLITALLSYFYVKQSFAPVDVLSKQIARIRQNRLNERVPVSKSHDELNQLATNFNKMLERIESAFNVQRSFIQHASHELRTPLANLITSCEAALKKELTLDQYRELIESLNEEHRNLVELTNALLLLSKYEEQSDELQMPDVRTDEVLFATIDEVQTLYPDYIFHFKFNELPQNENDVMVKGNEVLLKTAIGNLLRNACKYSDNKQINIRLSIQSESVYIEFENTGETLEDNEFEQVTEPFYRGKNSAGQKGYGLGLSIVKRVVELHKGKLTYQKQNNLNLFILQLPRTAF